MTTIKLTWIHNYINSNGAELYKQTDIGITGITWNYRKWRWNKTEVQTKLIQNASFEFIKVTDLDVHTAIQGNIMFVHLPNNRSIRLCLLLDTVILLRAEAGEFTGDGDWVRIHDFGAKVLDDIVDTHFILNGECNLFK